MSLSRKERERLLHRGEMLEAAEKLFSEKGYHATTMQEIAEQAEFSVGALYDMFEGKDDLYGQLIEMRANEYCERVYERIASEKGPLDKIRAVVATKLAFFNEHKQFFRVFAHLASEERSEAPPAMFRHCTERYMDYQATLRAIFQEGIKHGVFADQNPSLLVLCLEGITNAVIGRWIHTGETELEELAPEAIESIILRGILAEGKR